mmetsp:Transcript_49575/g.112916  ORF Transcript_49575/g.112916 Transcript_49575/m.112916 type:complete len:392 (+) Transcript_49575:111-1286(+)
MGDEEDYDLPELAVGAHVELIGLKSRPDLNDRQAEVLRNVSGRWEVQMLDDKEIVRCKEANFIVVRDAAWKKNWCWTAKGIASLATKGMQAELGRPGQGDPFTEEHLFMLRHVGPATLDSLELAGEISSGVARQGMSGTTMHPGQYVITDTSELTRELDRYSESLDDLAVGKVVNILEVACFENLERGRVERPKGWISLLDKDEGYRWVSKQSGGSSQGSKQGAGQQTGQHAGQPAGHGVLQQHLLSDGQMVLKADDGTIYNFRTMKALGKLDPKRNVLLKPLGVGAIVKLMDLKKRPDLNEMKAEVKSYDAEAEKWDCHIQEGDASGTLVRVKTENLFVLVGAPEGAAPPQPSSSARPQPPKAPTVPQAGAATAASSRQQPPPPPPPPAP